MIIRTAIRDVQTRRIWSAPAGAEIHGTLREKARVELDLPIPNEARMENTYKIFN